MQLEYILVKGLCKLCISVFCFMNYLKCCKRYIFFVCSLKCEQTDMSRFECLLRSSTSSSDGSMWIVSFSAKVLMCWMLVFRQLKVV
jgi:hypothetical protein